MKYYIKNEEFYHHGIKGMKWGVRKKSQVAIKCTRPRSDSVAGNNETLGHKPKNKKRGKRRMFDMGKASSVGYSWLHNNNALLGMQSQQAQQWAMEQANRASINAALQTASLSMSGGTTPFMFGMM